MRFSDIAAVVALIIVGGMIAAICLGPIVPKPPPIPPPCHIVTIHIDGQTAWIPVFATNLSITIDK